MTDLRSRLKINPDRLDAINNILLNPDMCHQRFPGGSGEIWNTGGNQCKGRSGQEDG